MTVDPVVEDGVVAGNYYPKYSTRNPVSRFLVDRFLRQVDSLVGEVNPGKIHEVGCGEGELISRYVRPGRVLLASDFSSQILEKARRNAQTKALQVDFIVRSIYELEEIDSASLILCSEVLEHLEDPDNAVKRLAQVARPYLIASVPREPLWRILNMIRGKYMLNLGNTPGHLQHFSKSGFIRLLGQRFEIVKVLDPLPWTLVLARVRTNV